MGQYDKYPVRNAYGHIEYLTREEIENLQDRGEGIEVLSDRPGKTPPFAQNPANQAEVNRLWYEQQRKKHGGRGKTVAKGIASAAIALHGATTQPQQQSDTTQRGYGESSLRAEGKRRGGQASDAARDKGNRDSGSGQR